MSSFTNLHPDVAASILTADSVAALANETDPQEGDIRYVIDTDALYTYDGSTWSAVTASGGVQPPAPATSTDNAVVRWDGTDASTVQNSTVVISDAGVVTGLSFNADGSGNAITNIENADIKAGAAIDATKIADGTVTDTEFQYIGGLTSDAQTQLTANATAISDHISDATDAHDASAVSNVPSGNLSATDLQGAVNELQSDIDLRELSSNKGIAGGYASLDGGGKIPVTQLPSALLTYEGTWDASTNTPTLANGTGDAGMVYIVSVAGTVNFGAGNITFAIGDWVIYNGTIWQKSDNTDEVVSVNGFTGVVTLDYDDVNAISEMGAVTDNRIIRSNGTTGDLIQQSGITIDDSDQITGVARIQVDNIAINGNAVFATSGDLELDAGVGTISFVSPEIQLLSGCDLVLWDNDDTNAITVTVPNNITANRSPQIPDDTGDFVLTSATQTITNKTIVASQLTGSVAGTAVATGYVGEFLSASAGPTAIGTTETDLVTLTLTTGVWLISASQQSDGNTGVLGSVAYLYIKNAYGAAGGRDFLATGDDGASGARIASSHTFAARVVVVASGDADKTIKVRAKTYSAGTSNMSGYIAATRIA